MFELMIYICQKKTSLCRKNASLLFSNNSSLLFIYIYFFLFFELMIYIPLHSTEWSFCLKKYDLHVSYYNLPCFSFCQFCLLFLISCCLLLSLQCFPSFWCLFCLVVCFFFGFVSPLPQNTQSPWKTRFFLFVCLFPFLVGCLVGLLLAQQPPQQPAHNQNKQNKQNQKKETKTTRKKELGRCGALHHPKPSKPQNQNTRQNHYQKQTKIKPTEPRKKKKQNPQTWRKGPSVGMWQPEKTCRS